MKLTELGERNLIKRFGSVFGEQAIEDDCAIVPINGRYFMLFTTDVITQKSHIPPTALPRQIGYYACAVNLSDIAAKGGEPKGLLFATTYPPDTKVDFVMEIAEGISECAKRYSVPVLGGDTKEGNELTIAGMAIGIVRDTMLLRRRGAKPGDAVYITGTVGRGGAAYLSLQYGYEQKRATKDLLEITPRLETMRQIARIGCITSAIDTSDGVAAALQQIGELNDVGFQIEANALPVDEKAKQVSARFNIRLEDFIFYGGDYEVVFTVDASKEKEFEMKCRKKKLEVKKIGQVTAKKSIMLLYENRKVVDLGQYGYEHFSQRKNPEEFVSGPSGIFR